MVSLSFPAPVILNLTIPGEGKYANFSPAFPRRFSHSIILLAKKDYIFTNNKNNVLSGQISGANAYSTNNIGGGSGGGLTKKQIWARVSRGFAPSGMPSKRYGVQTQHVTIPNLYDTSNNFNQPTITTNGRSFINVCKFKLF